MGSPDGLRQLPMDDRLLDDRSRSPTAATPQGIKNNAGAFCKKTWLAAIRFTSKLTSGLGNAGTQLRQGRQIDADQLIADASRTHTSKGFLEAILNAKQEWRISRLHRSELKKVGPFLQRREKKVNLGCGPNPKPGWINIDLFDPGADLRLDLREKWPFADSQHQSHLQRARVRALRNS